MIAVMNITAISKMMKLFDCIFIYAKVQKNRLIFLELPI